MKSIFQFFRSRLKLFLGGLFLPLFLSTFLLAKLDAQKIPSNQVNSPNSPGPRVTERFGQCATCDIQNISADTYVSEKDPSQNFGALEYLLLRAKPQPNYPLIRFDLTSIPANTSIQKATLRLFNAPDFASPTKEEKRELKIPIFLVSDPAKSGNWVENQATFNNKTESLRWTKNGNLKSALVSATSTIYLKNWLSNSQDLFEADLTKAVQKWVSNPTSNLGLVVRPDGLVDLAFWSKEALDPAKRPYLEITYSGNNPENIPSPTNLSAKFYSGQTFLTWKEAATGKDETSYKIYRHTSLLTTANLHEAALIDQVYQGSSYLSDRVIIKQPDLTKAGVSLTEDSGLYVYTVENPDSSFWAVTTVVEGNEKREIFPDQNATTQPVEEDLGFPDAFFFKATEDPRYYLGYVLFLSRFNPLNPNDAFGFDNRRSAPFFFSVALPHRVTVAKKPFKEGDQYPLTLYLHAYGKNYFASQEGVDNCRYFDENRYGGFCLGINDSPVLVFKDKTGQVLEMGPYLEAETYGYSWYLGWNSNYTPTKLFQNLPKSFQMASPYGQGKSVLYTEKAIKLTIQWLREKSEWAPYLDKKRLYLTGGSMGASGALNFAIHSPEMVAAVNASQGGVVGYLPQKGYIILTDILFGPIWQNIKTPEGVGIFDYLNLAKAVQENPSGDYPAIRMKNGKNDQIMPWEPLPKFYQAVQKAKSYLYAVFDQSEHNGFEANYFPEYVNERSFVENIPVLKYNLFHFRTDQSFPAFTNFGLNENPGNGRPQNGDLRGGLSRYAYFEPNSILDTQNQYEIKLFLLGEAPDDSAKTTVTLKRLQKLIHSPGTIYHWQNLKSDGVVGQEGQVTADQNGVISIDNLLLGKETTKLTLFAPPQEGNR